MVFKLNIKLLIIVIYILKNNSSKIKLLKNLKIINGLIKKKKNKNLLIFFCEISIKLKSFSHVLGFSSILLKVLSFSKLNLSNLFHNGTNHLFYLVLQRKLQKEHLYSFLFLVYSLYGHIVVYSKINSLLFYHNF